MSFFTEVQKWFTGRSNDMATVKAIQKLEDKVIATAGDLVLAVIADEVKRGVTGLANPMGKCLTAINNLRVAKGQTPL